MAVLVTNADGNLSDANRFNTVISHNLGCAALWGNFGLSLPQTYAITFSGAANLKGIGVALSVTNSNTTIDRSVFTSLQEINATCTMTIASPCVVTLAGHGYLGGERIMLATTGALPTGLSINTVYFIKYINANTFNLSLTSGGANINTSGSQSGTHTVWTIRTDSTLTYSQICGSQTNRVGTYIVPFDFSPVYAVDTTASKWRINFIQTGGTTGTWLINCSNHSATIANLFHIAYTDTNATFVSGSDTPCVRHYLAIDQTATFEGVAATGTDFGGALRYACIVFSNPGNPAPADVAYLKWQNAPAAAYDLTIKGRICLASYSGFRVGTAASPIPVAQQARILTSTNAGGIYSIGDGARSAENSSLFLYGAKPTYRKSTVNGTALAGQKIVNTDDSTGWSVGNKVFYGKMATDATPTTSNTINAIAGTQITLTNNLSHDLMDDGVIFVEQGYGVELIGTSSFRFNFFCYSFANLTVDGVRMYEPSVTISRQTQYTANYPPDAGNYAKISLADIVIDGTYSGGVVITTPNVGGIDILRVYANQISPFGIIAGAEYTSNSPCGATLVEDCIAVGGASSNLWISGVNGGCFYGSPTKNITVNRNKIYNIAFTQFSVWQFNGSNIVVSNNEFYSIKTTGTSASFGCIAFVTTVGIVCSGNTFNRCTTAYSQVANAFMLNGSSNGDTFGNLTANTQDLQIGLSAFIQLQFNTPLSNVNFLTTNYNQCLAPSRVAVVSENNTANKDTVYFPWGTLTKTGGSLADTTTRLGSGYAWKLTPTQTNGTDLFTWPGSDNANKQVIPSGSLQNKSPAVGIWVKINNAAYYAGTHTKPTLVINYDNGTTVEVAATATTSWQRLAISFTPLTTYGQYSWYLKAATDATGTNRDWYCDDFQNTYPNATVELGNLDLSANAEPVFPPVALNIISSAVGWDQRLADFNTAGTMGAVMNSVNGKLPTNYIMGSSVLTAKDDEIDTINSRVDVTLSSRSSHGAADVWAVGTRTLTSFGTLVADIWANATRTLSSFGTLVSDVWAAATRTITGGTVTTNNDKTGYGLANDSITANVMAADAVTEIQSGLSTLAAADIRTAIGMASANFDTQLSAVTTQTNKLTFDGSNRIVADAQAISASTVAADSVESNIGNLDATISSRAATGAQMALTTAAVDAFWDELMSGHNISGTSGEFLTTMKKIIQNRAKHDGALIKLYDDDDTTVLWTYPVKDKNGDVVNSSDFAVKVPVEKGRIA